MQPLVHPLAHNTNEMMLIQKIFSKRRHRTATNSSSSPSGLLLSTWCLLLVHLQLFHNLTPTISALYLGPQQMPEFANNPALVQSLNQMVAQQVAGGVPSGQLQVSASTGLNGVVSLASSGVPTSSGGNITTQAIPTQAAAAASSSVQLAANAAANPAAQGNSNQFVIKWIHNDSKNGVAYVSITPVNHTNLHEPRIELRYNSKLPWVNLPESSGNNTLVALVIVQDEDSGPNGETSLSIEHGNELGHFKLISTGNSNSIQVNGAPLSRQRVPEYNLTIVARDHGSPPKSSSITLVIKLQPSPSSSQHSSYSPLFPADASLYNKPPVTDLMYVGTMLVLMFAAIVILIIFGCALVQRPSQKPVSKHHSGGIGSVGGGHHNNHHHHHHHHPSLSGSIGGGGSHKGLVPAPRTTSAANSRIIPPPGAGPPSTQCSTYCLTSTGGGPGPGGYNRTNL